MLINQTAQSEFIGLPSYGYVAFGQPSALPDAGEPAAIGNVLANDAGAQPSDTLSVVGVQAGQHGNAVTGGVGETLTGTYGTLILLADGSYTYNLDNGDRDTNALLDGEVVFDRFSYTAADEDGNTAVAEIAIQITGAADIGQTIVTSGSAPIYLVGGDGDDTLQSSSNADRLVGGGGNDTLISGGIDTFVFNSPEEGFDTITGFVSGSGDKFEISADGFGGGLAAGGSVELVTATDVASANGVGSDGCFIFDNDGADIRTLYWDANGGNGSDAIALAILNGVSTLQQSDFLIV
jgi:VCBS repeat-containing protein